MVSGGGAEQQLSVVRGSAPALHCHDSAETHSSSQLLLAALKHMSRPGSRTRRCVFACYCSAALSPLRSGCNTLLEEGNSVID